MQKLFPPINKILLIPRKGLGNEAFPDRNPQSEFTSGEENSEFQGSSRWNSSVYSSVLTSRNPDFDLGVDKVDTLFP